MEFLDDIVEVIYTIFLVSLAVLTIPIWFFPYLIYKIWSNIK